MMFDHMHQRMSSVDVQSWRVIDFGRCTETLCMFQLLDFVQDFGMCNSLWNDNVSDAYDRPFARLIH